MTLHLVYEKDWVPSTRIRLRQLVPHLEARGLACRVWPYPRTPAAQRELEEALAAGDAVLIHRARPSRADARWWRGLPVPRIYSFDDAIMLGRRRGLAGVYTRLKRGRGFRRMLRVCDAVVCGNAWLGSQCARAGLPVAIVPSPVPLDVPQMQDRPPGDVLRIGWVGQRSNLPSLRAIGGALARLASERDFRLTVISNGELDLPGCRVDNVRWSLEGEAWALAQLDVGIMPLGDDAWSRGKCAYKLLQYMAAGVPAVGSDVGMNRDVIDSGRNGFLARTDSDWVEQLRGLIDDAELRRRVGRAGRATVEARYAYAVIAERVVSFVGEVVASAALRPSNNTASVSSTTRSAENAAARSRSAPLSGG